MSEGSRRCYHVGMWEGGTVAKKGWKCRVVLHFVASGRGRGLTAEGAGGAEGMDSCLRRNDGWGAGMTDGDENGLAPGTGNHKGCPYDGFIGAYFHSNDHGLAKAT